MIQQPSPTPATANPAGRLPVWVRVLAFVILAAFLIAIAFGLRRSTQGAVVIGQRIPPVRLTTFDNLTLSTTDAALSGKVIVINFWASWCNPCASEAAVLQQAWERYQPEGKVVFLGIDYVDTEPEARAYLTKYGVTYPNGPDLGTVASTDFRITGVPETYIIDRQGKLAYKQVGPFQSVQEILALIDPLLK
jgi:cytochrome c biogenesis protein CcmG, thiol:disulfide interchange protein DsbE